MSKTTVFIRLFGVMAFLILVIPVATYADQYYDQYPGNGFQPKSASLTYGKSENSFIYHSDTTDAYYFCPVNFSVPDGSTHFIKSIGIRFYDSLTDGNIYVELKRKNLYTGAIHTVAWWTSGFSETTVSEQTASKGTESGVKLIDAKKFAYFLYIFFFREGSVSPGGCLVLYQVRIHYGT
jgi:hypothetical protein